MDDSAYTRIAQKIEDQDPHTAPKAGDGSIHEAFIGHLKLIYAPEEAEVVQYLNLLEDFTSTEQLAEMTGKSLAYIEKILADVHSKHGVVGLENLYCLPPIPLIVNANSFDPEVKPDDLRAAAFYQEYFIKGGFYKYYESTKKGTPMARIIPVNHAIEANQKVLAAEEAHDYILNHTSEELSLVPCPCRTRTEKMGTRECRDKNPIGACIMLGLSVGHFETNNLGKRVTKEQAIQYFDEMQELGLVGQTLNASYGDMLICLCCGCCCSQVRGRTRWDNPDALSPSNFAPRAGEDCIGCGTCTERCFFEAITLNDETDQIQVDVDKCIGCGVCTLACPQETLKLQRYERSTPYETTQQLFETARRENRE
jgi:ferredoxin